MPGPAQRVLDLVERRLQGIWTLIPCVVDTVNQQAMTVDISIKVTRPNKYLKIEKVPVVFPRGGNSIILMPIKSGDVVLVGFSKYSLQSLLTDIQVVIKDNLDRERKFHYSDAIILAGFVLENEKGSQLMAGANFEIPDDDITIVAEDQVNVGRILYLLDRQSDPPSPQNGMIWRNGTVVKIRSQDVTQNI